MHESLLRVIFTNYHDMSTGYQSNYTVANFFNHPRIPAKDDDVG